MNQKFFYSWMIPVFFATGRDPSETAVILNRDLERVNDWATKWKVLFNPGKSKDLFSKNRPLGWFCHRVAMSIYMSICPLFHVFVFTASYWASGHLIRSRPLISRSPPLLPPSATPVNIYCNLGFFPALNIQHSPISNFTLNPFVQWIHARMN